MTIDDLRLSYEKDGPLLRDAMLKQKLVDNEKAIADALIAAGKLVPLPKGSVLYTEGSLFEGVYFLLYGSIALTRDDMRLTELQPSNEVGTWPLLFPIPTYFVTATAVSDSVLFRVERPAFREVADKYPGLWRRLAANQASHLDAMNKDSKKWSAGDCDVLFIVALREEAGFFEDRLSKFQHVTGGAIPHYRGVLDVKGRALTIRMVTQTLMGGIEAASLATRAIYLMRPKLVVMTGIMGGFSHQKVSLGDVIIAQEAFDYGFGKVTKSKKGLKRDEFLRDPRFVAIDATLGEKLNNWLVADTKNQRSERLADARRRFFERRGTPPEVTPAFGSQIHFGPVASGSLVVASQHKIAEIRQIHRHTYGVEMEIAGLLHAARACSVPAVAIKGVSDLADPNKDQAGGPDATHARAFAAFGSMEVAWALIEQGIVP
jgi:nucleoside phosphorylase